MTDAYTLAKEDITDLRDKLRSFEDGWDVAKGEGLAEALGHLLRGKELGLQSKEALMYAGENIFRALMSIENDPAYKDGLLEGLDIIHDEFHAQYVGEMGILPHAYKE